MSETTNISINDEKDKMNAFGIDIAISDILGGKIVDQFIAQLTPEDMQIIYDKLDSLIFDRSIYDDKKELKIKETSKDKYGYSQEKETKLYTYTTNLLNDKLNEKVFEKINEILESEEYEKMATDIANEVINYALNGYKEDMINRIRERLVTNITDSNVMYNNKSLSVIVNQIIDARFGCR